MGPHVPPQWAANAVTAVRLVLTAGVGALVLRPDPTDAQPWCAVGLASGALVLDGVDGLIARRGEIASGFGARFDMEVDAALILVLATGLAWSGKVGWWVLAIGLARYAFGIAGRVWPVLRGELPPSLARKAVAVQQGVTLTVATAPVVPPWLAVAGCAPALGCLAWSFGRDVRTLVRTGVRPASG
ncbi:MAG TPA: CDP-alcohol phosphatidyltransferase family protein [Jiangellales bacterium]|nr:CDP-alcohol phosphatidyltransferase family protein [Jiangellales bacterium]